MVGISDRNLDLPEVEFPKIEKTIANTKGIISLGPGQPDFVTPKPILSYTKKILKKATRYTEPQGLLEFREIISKKLFRENKIKTSPENIVVGPGSQEVLFAGLLATVDPKEEVIVPSPGYLGYIPAIELVNGKPVYLKLEEEDGFQINPDLLRKKVDRKKTKVIILNSPGNPTGTVFSRKILEEIADIAVDTKTYVFSDEAYEKILYDGAKHVSIGSLNGMSPYTVTFQSFSKSFAMCGFRLGYATGPKKLIDAMVETHNYVSLCAPMISQMAGMKALMLEKKYVNEMVKEYDRRRWLIVKRLNEIGLETQMPKGAFYAFSNIRKYGKNSVNFYKKMIKDARVAVIPGTEFGPHGEGYIRSSFATKYEKIAEAMNRMEKVLR